MALYFDEPNGFRLWRGEPINGILYPPIIEEGFSSAELANLNLYKPEPADPVPPGYKVSHTSVERVEGVVRYVNVLTPNGVVTLGPDGLIPSNLLPISGSYRGSWNADTNSPVLVEGEGTNGDEYVVSVAGTQVITGSPIAYSVGDRVKFTINGNKWERIPNSQSVLTVAGKMGNVVLVADDITNLQEVAKTGSAQDLDDGPTKLLMTSGERTKLTGVAVEATKNQTDAFLLDRTNHTGSQPQSTISGLVTALANKLETSMRGATNGLASLDATGKVPAAQLPSFVDDVLEYTFFVDLPGTGESGKIYVITSTAKQYRWTGSAYSEIVPSPGSTDALAEGATNKYFTEARVRGTLLTGLGYTSAVVGSTDTVLSAMGKLQQQVWDRLQRNVNEYTTGWITANGFGSTSGNINVDADGNRHVWFRSAAGINRGIIYHDHGGQFMSINLYNTSGAFRQSYTFKEDGDVYFSGHRLIINSDTDGGVTSGEIVLRAVNNKSHRIISTNNDRIYYQYSNNNGLSWTTLMEQNYNADLTINGHVWAPAFRSWSNGTGYNFSIGDDAWFGDMNISNTAILFGQGDASNGWLKFGNTAGPALGVNGNVSSGRLYWGSQYFVQDDGNMYLPWRGAYLHQVFDIKAEFNNQTDVNALGFPVGTLLIIYTNGASLPRNGGVSPCLSNNDTKYYRVAGSPNAGTQLHGSWRSCGHIDSNWVMAQRVG